jgi:hypothetical protein
MPRIIIIIIIISELGQFNWRSDQAIGWTVSCRTGSGGDYGGMQNLRMQFC